MCRRRYTVTKTRLTVTARTASKYATMTTISTIRQFNSKLSLIRSDVHSLTLFIQPNNKSLAKKKKKREEEISLLLLDFDPFLFHILFHILFIFPFCCCC